MWNPVLLNGFVYTSYAPGPGNLVADLFSMDGLLSVPKTKAALLILVKESFGLYTYGSGMANLSFEILYYLLEVPILYAGGDFTVPILVVLKS